MIEALRSAGFALSNAILPINEFTSDSSAAILWSRAANLEGDPEDQVTAMVNAGKSLRDLAGRWLNEELPEEILEGLEEAIKLWDTVQCPSAELPGKTMEEGGPAYY